MQPTKWLVASPLARPATGGPCYFITYSECRCSRSTAYYGLRVGAKVTNNERKTQNDGRSTQFKLKVIQRLALSSVILSHSFMPCQFSTTPKITIRYQLSQFATLFNAYHAIRFLESEWHRKWHRLCKPNALAKWAGHQMLKCSLRPTHYNNTLLCLCWIR